MIRGLGIALGVLLFSYCAWAQESMPLPASSSSSESQSEILNKVKQKKFEEDTRITDLQIRADAGSLSRYSTKFTLGYTGPGLTDLSRPYAPNPDSRSGDFRDNISGQVGMRYRMSPDDALYFSGGMRMNFVGQVGNNQDINDPGISYDRTYLITPAIQAHSTFFANYVTTSYYRRLGETSGIGAAQTVKWNVGTSKWILGMEFSVSDYFFGRGYAVSDRNATDYYANVIPSVEYRLAHNLNFNTSWLQQLNHYRSQQVWSTIDDSNYLSQRIGVGWAITRDIYFNPFINIYPMHLGWSTSSIAFNTVFSVF